MMEAFRVIVPTLDRMACGTIWPAGDISTGLVLFDRTMVRPGTIQPLYRELAMYVQAAGMPALQVEPKPGADITSHACDVLAAVAFMQLRGARRVILISTVDEGLVVAAAADVAGGTLAGLVDLMRRRYGSDAELREAATALIATVRAVAGGVAGVATLSAPPPARPAASSRSPAPTLMRVPSGAWQDTETVGADTETAAETTQAPPAELHLRLPSGDPDHASAEIISQLYSWALQIHHGSGIDRADARARHPQPVASMPKPRNKSFMQLERDWEAITQALAARAPERASLARAAEGQRRAREESIVRGAGRAWLYLDDQARQDWLHCCARIFGTTGSITHQAALNAAAVRANHAVDVAVAPTATSLPLL